MARREDGALELRDAAGSSAICIDWTDADVQRRVAAGRRQLLARAAGLHKLAAGDPPLQVLDATAGLGRDGFVLAALGAQVTLLERLAPLVDLLADARTRALAAGGPAAAAAQRIEVHGGDARMLPAGAAWDVVFLDPLYPDPRRTALSKKAMQCLRELGGDDADAGELLPAVLPHARRRVAVKRPRGAPPLAGLAPAFVLEGSQLRFDVYLGRAGA